MPLPSDQGPSLITDDYRLLRETSLLLVGLAGLSSSLILEVDDNLPRKQLVVDLIKRFIQGAIQGDLQQLISEVQSQVPTESKEIPATFEQTEDTKATKDVAQQPAIIVEGVSEIVESVVEPERILPTVIEEDEGGEDIAPGPTPTPRSMHPETAARTLLLEHIGLFTHAEIFNAIHGAKVECLDTFDREGWVSIQDATVTFASVKDAAVVYEYSANPAIGFEIGDALIAVRYLSSKDCIPDHIIEASYSSSSNLLNKNPLASRALIINNFPVRIDQSHLGKLCKDFQAWTAGTPVTAIKLWEGKQTVLVEMSSIRMATALRSAINGEHAKVLGYGKAVAKYGRDPCSSRTVLMPAERRYDDW